MLDAWYLLVPYNAGRVCSRGSGTGSLQAVSVVAVRVIGELRAAPLAYPPFSHLAAPRCQVLGVDGRDMSLPFPSWLRHCIFFI